MEPALISILLPTRLRPALVERSVRSLLHMSRQPSRIEVMIAYDQDDTLSHAYFAGVSWSQMIADHGARHTCLCVEPMGYSGLHKYYTELAQRSNGEWLMIWNDDAVMLTADWDQRVYDNKDFVGMLHMTTENFKPQLTLFPLVPRLWLDLFGHMSLHQLTDSWIQEICHQADAVRSIPVSVFHDRYDVTGNNLDATFQNRRYDKKAFHHENMQRIRTEWAQRLKSCR